MTFRRGAGGKRRDANEGAIAEALRGVGCEIYYVSGLGLPDLLVKAPADCGGQWVPMEIKTPKGKLRASQVGASWIVVRSVEDALRAIGVRT